MLEGDNPLGGGDASKNVMESRNTVWWEFDGALDDINELTKEYFSGGPCGDGRWWGLGGWQARRWRGLLQFRAWCKMQEGILTIPLVGGAECQGVVLRLVW